MAKIHAIETRSSCCTWLRWFRSWKISSRTKIPLAFQRFTQDIVQTNSCRTFELKKISIHCTFLDLNQVLAKIAWGCKSPDSSVFSAKRKRKMRVPNSFFGMQDLAYFALIFGIRAENKGGKRELQLVAGVGVCVLWVGKRDSQGEKSGIWYLISYMTSKNDWPAQKHWEKWTFCSLCYSPWNSWGRLLASVP